MSDIVERLRETIVAYDTWYQGQLKTSDTLLERFSRERHEAAEEITHLRAENEKLREALKPFARMAADYEDWETEKITMIVLLRHLRAASAAIREGGE